MNELEDRLVVQGACRIQEGFCFNSKEIEHIYMFDRTGRERWMVIEGQFDGGSSLEEGP